MALSGRSTLAALCLLLALTTSAAAESARSFRVQVTGTGRPILLIPGLASSGDTWTTTVAHLSGRFICHVLTLAGFAGTPPIDGPLFPTVRRDLAFLDIQMPGGSGFDVLERLERVPLVVFTTAFDEYAVRAFEVNAFDYLMKPVRPERLASVLEKARSTLIAGRDSRPDRPRSSTEPVFLRDGERCWIVQWAEIVLFEVEGNYARAYFGSNRPLIRASLNALEARLDPALFFRASRQHIVNLRFIESVESSADDTYVIRMKNTREVPVSRRQSRQLRESLGL